MYLFFVSCIDYIVFISVITDKLSWNTFDSNIVGTTNSSYNQTVYMVSSKAYNITTNMPIALSSESQPYQTNVSSITLSSSSAYEFWEYVYFILTIYVSKTDQDEI